MAFIDRRQRGPGRFLEWKIRLVAVGAVLLLVGMARNLDLLVLLSIIVLALAFVLRFFEKDPPHPDADEEDAVDDLDGDSAAAERPPHRRADDPHDDSRPID